MSRKNKRKRTEYRDRLGFNPWKYIGPKAVPPTAPAENKISRPTVSVRIPQRGDIWFADLGNRSGTSVQGGCRPVLVISNDAGNTHADTVNVLPMTRRIKKPGLPCHTELAPDSVSDKHQILDASMVLAEQITTIGKAQMKSYVGHIREDVLLNAVNRAVSVQLGLMPAGSYTEYTEHINHINNHNDNFAKGAQ